jgi:hypothetical protein
MTAAVYAVALGALWWMFEAGCNHGQAWCGYASTAEAMKPWPFTAASAGTMPWVGRALHVAFAVGAIMCLLPPRSSRAQR